MTKVLLTGASGFVGSHVLRHFMANTDWELWCPVTFKHKGNADRIASAIEQRPDWEKRIHVFRHDLTAPFSATQLNRLQGVDFIVNVASESHVDRSITEPVDFIQNNVALVLNVLEAARLLQPRVFLQVSTDEVYGPAYGSHRHAEWEVIAPSNPYSASKAAQEAICFSYWRTYDVPLVITNTMNIIGEMQDPEKFVPMTIKKLLAGEPVTVHVSSEGKPGSRFYLHARNQADALLFILREVEPTRYSGSALLLPDRFNVVGEREVFNDEMVELIADVLDTGALVNRVDFHSSRPGHDLRYALDGWKLEEFGWTPPVSLERSLERTVQWTVRHPEWLLS